MKKILCILAYLAVVAAAQAGNSTIVPTAANVYGDQGTTLLPTLNLIVFVADVAGDGFGDWDTLGVDTFLADSDDDVLLGTHSSGELGAGVVNGTYEWLNTDSVAGEPYAMLWFNRNYEEGLSGAGASVDFGVYETGLTVPAVGSTETGLYWLTSEAGGSLPADTFHTTYSTIPEPSTLLLSVLGLAAMVNRRRVNR